MCCNVFTWYTSVLPNQSLFGFLLVTMKVIVFGGTGPTGKAVLQKSVQDPGMHVICKLFIICS